MVKKICGFKAREWRVTMSITESSWIKRLNGVNNLLKPNELNPSLIFNKYVLWDEIDENIPFLNHHKIDHFNRIVNCNFPLTFDNYNYLKNRKNKIHNSIVFELTTKTKLIVNHGMESILENSISMHPYYGFPVIPGSAIKGVTRNYCKEYINLNSKKVEDIFGSHKEEGKIVFLDAWPSIENFTNKGEELKLNYFYEIDVFTPHYQKYYQKKSYPSDNQTPIPINFLAVKNKIKFEFVISTASNYKKQNLECIKNLISEALNIFGIGAKTGSNYGYFE
jgi:CRISPR type III-B/RAMP module RAMP protein Cmr6